MKAIKEYGKAVYELSPEAQSNVEMFAKIAISKDGFLNEDQHEDLLADLIKVAEKHEKKNQ